MNDGNDEEMFGYQMEMPFVAVQSEGGIFEDKAFNAGFICGELYLNLKMSAALYDENDPEEVEPAVFPRGLEQQVDLIAMKFGFSTLIEETEVPEYLRATFSRDSAGAHPTD